MANFFHPEERATTKRVRRRCFSFQICLSSVLPLLYRQTFRIADDKVRSIDPKNFLKNLYTNGKICLWKWKIFHFFLHWSDFSLFFFSVSIFTRRWKFGTTLVETIPPRQLCRNNHRASFDRTIYTFLLNRVNKFLIVSRGKSDTTSSHCVVCRKGGESRKLSVIESRGTRKVKRR